MKRHVLNAIALIIVLLMSSCAGYSKGSDGINELEARLDKENERQNERIKAIDAYLSTIDERSMGSIEKRELINRIAVLESKVSDLERRNQTSKMITEEEDIVEHDNGERASLRIKVLSGDGSPTSAKRMAIRLERFGYKVERTDIATRRDFKKTQIFYSDANRKYAADIFRKIGGNADLKSITWQSVFDLIIVTGKP